MLPAGMGVKRAVTVALVVELRTYDGTGCKFESWQCQISIISHVHRAYDYSGVFKIL